MNRYGTIVIALLGALIATPSVAQVWIYTVESATAVDLGTLGGDEAEAYDINNFGVIVGWARNSGNTKKAFIFHGSTMLPAGPSFSIAPSYAYGLNDSGEVVGYYYDFQLGRPFYWHPAVGTVEMSNKIHPEEGPDKYHALPLAINYHGRIVGEAYGSSFQPSGDLPWASCYVSLPVQWASPHADPDILFCPYDVYPGDIIHDINNSGAIVVNHNQWDDFHGYVVKDREAREVPPASEEDRSGVKVFGINESDRVVGSQHIGSDLNAIYWNGSTSYSKNLGTLQGGTHSEAYEINDSDFVAGYSNTLLGAGGLFTQIRKRGFLWNVKFGMYALPVPPGFTPILTDCVARSINNRNASTGKVQLAGYCTKNGKSRAVRWDVYVKKVSIGIGM